MLTNYKTNPWEHLGLQFMEKALTPKVYEYLLL